MMNQEVKTSWIAALESGEYAQGRGVLREGNKFCCLGVLCDLAVKKGVIPKPHLGDGYTSYGIEQKTYVLPKEVLEWAGLESPNPLIIKGQTNLASMNDRGGSFKEIASVIKENL